MAKGSNNSTELALAILIGGALLALVFMPKAKAQSLIDSIQKHLPKKIDIRNAVDKAALKVDGWILNIPEKFGHPRLADDATVGMSNFIDSYVEPSGNALIDRLRGAGVPTISSDYSTEWISDEGSTA